jgi:hypothetical protein
MAVILHAIAGIGIRTTQSAVSHFTCGSDTIPSAPEQYFHTTKTMVGSVSLIICMGQLIYPFHRVDALSQLQRIAIDLVDPSLYISQDVMRWRHQSLDVFEYFFKALWSTQHDVRQAASCMALALLPTHLEAITQFWALVLPQTTVPRRLGTISFMLQLRPHFPQWQCALSCL